MTGFRETRAIGRTSKDVLQFAPNFTVYVLPPDVVCLYSEDRKFFLHGQLYCELASAIGKNGKSVQALLDALAQKFPSDKINEAIKRLIDRCYVVRATQVSSGIVAAIGRCSACCPRSRRRTLKIAACAFIRSTCRAGPNWVRRCESFGVRVVKNSPDLTVTLVNDYLERQLAELNLQRVSDKTRWLLVWPSGVFPLVDPCLALARVPAGPACSIA